MGIIGKTSFTNTHPEVMVKHVNGTVILMKNATSMSTITIVTTVNFLTLVIPLLQLKSQMITTLSMVTSERPNISNDIIFVKLTF